MTRLAILWYLSILRGLIAVALLRSFATSRETTAHDVDIALSLLRASA